MDKINCSVGILTFTSAATLRRTLESVREFDDIVICDGGSTDGTLSIASEFGARVLAQDRQFKNADGTLRDFSGPRNQMLDAARHDWFLYIDSDEAISDGLREDIRRITDTAKDRPLQTYQGPSFALVYKVPYGIVIDGHLIKHSSNYPGYQHRFFNKRSGARFNKPVHERIYFDRQKVSVGTFAHPWLVYSTRGDLGKYLRETAGYRAMEVKTFENRSLLFYVRWGVLKNLRTSAAAAVKAMYNYMRYGFADSSPVADELGRVLSPLVLMGSITRLYLRRLVRRVRRGRVRGREEPELRRLPALLSRMVPGRVFVDVGANTGAYVQAALAVLPPARIYAFEPHPTCAQGLRERFPRVVVEEKALSSGVGQGELKVPEVRGTAYLTRSTLERFVEQGETGAHYITVPLTTLDAYCTAQHIVPGVIKIDVEGHEEAVLEGAWETLRAHHPVLIVEIEQRRLKGPIEEQFKRLESLGYRGGFWDAASGGYISVEHFRTEKHQDMAHFKTKVYSNNFI